MQINADPAAIVVRNDAPWTTLREFLDDIRARPGRLKMSGTAAGAAWDLARAGLLLAADVPIEALVWAPSQGAAPSLVELLGGHIDAVCCSIPEAQSQLEAGQLRVLCVMSRERLENYPDVPTAQENGVDWEAVGWRGLFLPIGTPPEIQQRLQDKLNEIVNSPVYEEFMSKNGFEIAVLPPAGFASFLAEQERRWLPVVEAAGYAAEDNRPRVVTTSDPGPWSFPAALATLLVAGCMAVAGSTLWQRTQNVDSQRVEFQPGRMFNLVLLIVALLVYLAVMPWAGFLVSTQIFATAMMIRLGVRVHTALLVATTMLLVVYVLFVWQFRVVLPISPWWSF
jgi:hypothetical protein